MWARGSRLVLNGPDEDDVAIREQVRAVGAKGIRPRNHPNAAAHHYQSSSAGKEGLALPRRLRCPEGSVLLDRHCSTAFDRKLVEFCGPETGRQLFLGAGQRLPGAGKAGTAGRTHQLPSALMWRLGDPAGPYTLMGCLKITQQRTGDSLHREAKWPGRGARANPR